ncbi:MAG: hypothetical protein F4117_12220 [Acidimicrobiales bacterium]|nr:hypothetical protein [Acidimicrobiales bacterium]MXX43659.1 hypothetical protein [Acidimicrobiales bacterium]MXZ15580.1 hypothetical protein [Acidimicrobiales bacterium]MYB82222.1 hypothetical protein [Acidimicrobiales bacterium]MYD33718.1 hypothetical protein [Acidimicrobiales bacterium]
MHWLTWTTRLAVATLMALMTAACGGDDSSGLATLQGVTTTAPDETLTAAGAEEPTSGAGVARDNEETATSAAVGDTGTGDTGTDDTAADQSAAAATGDGDTASAGENDDLSDEERLLEFAQCMRDNGVEFPDPVVEADGTVAFGLRPGSGADAQDAEGLQAIGRDPDLPAAQAACREIIEGLALGPGGQNFDELQIEQMDRQLEFAQCMRDEGVDVSDPDPNAFGPGSGGGRPFGGLDFDDADVSAAFDVCGDRLPAGPGRGSRQ